MILFQKFRGWRVPSHGPGQAEWTEFCHTAPAKLERCQVQPLVDRWSFHEGFDKNSVGSIGLVDLHGHSTKSERNTTIKKNKKAKNNNT